MNFVVISSGFKEKDFLGEIKPEKSETSNRDI